jgi:hypothetical protein
VNRIFGVDELKKILVAVFVFAALSCAVYVLNFIYGATPQIPGQPWRVHDISRPLPEVISPGDSLGLVEPPPDALVLFDGTNLDHFNNKALEITDGAMVMGEGGQQTVASFADVQLHLEWTSPLPVTNAGQNRGNSGVIIMGLYEVQVLDSFQNPTYADGQAGAIYGVQPPRVNVSRPPGQWQSYDIFFSAPRFGSDGKLVSPARVTVEHNGVLVQLDQAFNGPSTWRRNGVYKAHAEKLPLVLQWHGSPVRYRNIWIRQLTENSVSRPQGSRN